MIPEVRVADFPQKDFSAGADHFVSSITESRQEGWRRKTKVENLITFHPATPIRRIFHILLNGVDSL
jgi:hypothetical protein